MRHPNDLSLKRQLRTLRKATDKKTPYGKCIRQIHIQQGETYTCPFSGKIRTQHRGDKTIYYHVTKGWKSVTAGNGALYRNMLDALYARVGR